MICQCGPRGNIKQGNREGAFAEVQLKEWVDCGVVGQGEKAGEEHCLVGYWFETCMFLGSGKAMSREDPPSWCRTSSFLWVITT